MASAISNVDVTQYLGNQKASTEKLSDYKNDNRPVKSDLDKDAFLKILVAKLQNQDPLNPMDDGEFLGQLAQFSTLEQMTNLNQSTSVSQAFGLVGKYVIAEVADSAGRPAYITGKVESVISDGGSISVNIEGVLVELDKVKEVLNEKVEVPPEEKPPTEGTDKE